MDAPLPQTIEEAVGRLIQELEPDQRSEIAALPKDAVVVSLHFGLGLYIRNAFGLWQGNEALWADTGAMDEDGASSTITLALWHHLQGVPLGELRRVITAR